MVKYKLHISDRAEEDAINAVDYYDSVAPDLAFRFLTELQDVYDKLKSSPQFFSYVSTNSLIRFRDVKLKSFPYVVIFEIQKNEVFITAVMNTHRRPLFS